MSATSMEDPRKRLCDGWAKHKDDLPFPDRKLRAQIYYGEQMMSLLFGEHEGSSLWDQLDGKVFSAKDREEWFEIVKEALCPPGNDAREEQASVLEQQLCEEFEGDYKDPGGLILSYVLGYIDQSFKQWAFSREKWYAPCAPIVQSSGWGKSRVIRELAFASNKLMVFYFTLMSPDSSGYPRSHADVRSHFMKISKPEHAYAVFWACFDWLSVEGSFPDKAKLFRSHQKRCYDGILARIQGQSERTKDQMWGAYTAVLRKFKGLLREEGPQFLFVVDEARALLQPISRDAEAECPFVIFRRACRDLPFERCGDKATGTFVLFVDTTARVGNFTPPMKEDPSARVSSGLVKLFGPLSRLPTFNLSESQPSSLEEIAKPRNLFVHGRPLWGARKFEEHIWDQEVLYLAAQKLLAGLEFESHNGRQKLQSPEMSLVLLGRLIGVDVCPQSTIAQELVASHMRVCLHTSAARDYVLTLALPEPVLAEAARQMLWNDRKLLNLQLRQLNSLLLNGIASAGERGELIARFLLLNAMDSLQSHYCPTTPVGLEAFLKAFIPSFEGFKSASSSHLKAGQVFFNAFYRFFDADPSAADLKTFIRKAGAMICARMQQAFDLLIPFVLPVDGVYDLDNDSCIGCLAIQVKNRKTITGASGTLDKMKAYQKTLVFRGKAVPNILMVLHLGGSDSEAANPEADQTEGSNPQGEGGNKKKRKQKKKKSTGSGGKTKSDVAEDTDSDMTFILEGANAVRVPDHLSEVLKALLCESPDPLNILRSENAGEREIDALKSILCDVYPVESSTARGSVESSTTRCNVQTRIKRKGLKELPMQFSARCYCRKRRAHTESVDTPVTAEAAAGAGGRSHVKFLEGIRDNML